MQNFAHRPSSQLFLSVPNVCCTITLLAFNCTAGEFQNASSMSIITLSAGRLICFESMLPAVCSAITLLTYISYLIQGVHQILCFFSLKFCDFSELCKFCCSAGDWPAAEGKPREARIYLEIFEYLINTQYLKFAVMFRSQLVWNLLFLLISLSVCLCMKRSSFS